MSMPKSGFVGAIEAFDLTSGRSAWLRESVLYSSFAVTPKGVVVAIAADEKATPTTGVYGEPPNSPPFRLALLALDSGTVVWRSAKSYGGSEMLAEPFVLVEQQRIFVVDRL